ncbi:MAG: CBS domain-containing protein [Jatrophihabitans sp.]
MPISDLLRSKSRGDGVVTIAPSDSITVLLAALAEHNVGALPVVEGSEVCGIVSERDVVRHIARHGADILHKAVSEIMTTTVVSCASTDDVVQVATTMTDKRIRHMPVIDDGALTGIISIGDVVSSRIRQLEQDRVHLEQYISG